MYAFDVYMCAGVCPKIKNRPQRAEVFLTVLYYYFFAVLAFIGENRLAVF